MHDVKANSLLSANRRIKFIIVFEKQTKSRIGNREHDLDIHQSTRDRLKLNI